MKIRRSARRKRLAQRTAGKPNKKSTKPALAKAGTGKTSDSGPQVREALRNPTGRLLATILGVLVLIYALALVFLRPPSPGRFITLDRFNRLAVCSAPPPPTPDPQLETYCRGVNDKIQQARLLDEDSRIVGTTVAKEGSDPVRYWTSYPKSDAATNDLIKNLYAGGAKVEVDAQPGKRLVRFLAQFVLPLVLLADLFALLFFLIQRKGESGPSDAEEILSFGQVGDKRVKRQDVHITFDDVAAAGESVAELAEVRDYLADPSAFTKMGAVPPKGVLLMGPPGCGKTLLARATAGEVRANFFSMSGSEFVEALVGIGAARVRDLFAQARANAPAIIFIDELDAVGRQRGAGVGQGHDEREQTLNELLVQMDGFSSSEGIVVMSATNRPDILDPGLLRAGRFDRQITVERPDREGRLEILQLHARGRRLSDPTNDLAHVARNTPGFTGADLANVLNEAALLAVRAGASSVGREQLDEAVDRVMAGPKRKGRILTEDEKRTIAYHEAGHALVAAAMGRAPEIQKLSIIARGRGIGHLALLDGDKTVVRRGDMEAQIAIAMAGFAAEELVFGEPSSGSETDLERATHMARDMAGRYGMSVRLGPVRVLAQEKEVFLGRDYLGTRDVSQPTLEHLDAEVRRIVDEQKELAREILQGNRRILDDIGEDLASRETVQGPQLEETLRRVKGPADLGNGQMTKPRSRAAKATAKPSVQPD